MTVLLVLEEQLFVQLLALEEQLFVQHLIFVPWNLLDSEKSTVYFEQLNY